MMHYVSSGPKEAPELARTKLDFQSIYRIPDDSETAPTHLDGKECLV